MSLWRKTVHLYSRERYIDNEIVIGHADSRLAVGVSYLRPYSSSTSYKIERNKMNWLQWVMFSFWAVMGFSFGYIKGYENAKKLWYVKGRMAVRKELGL